eukprot:SAG22_NODE_1020_length_5999_cov_8.921186_8_plen_158_part_01
MCPRLPSAPDRQDYAPPRICRRTSAGSSESNGGMPESIRCRITPADQMSQETAWPKMQQTGNLVRGAASIGQNAPGLHSPGTSDRHTSGSTAGPKQLLLRGHGTDSRTGVALRGQDLRRDVVQRPARGQREVVQAPRRRQPPPAPPPPPPAARLSARP